MPRGERGQRQRGSVDYQRLSPHYSYPCSDYQHFYRYYEHLFRAWTAAALTVNVGDIQCVVRVMPVVLRVVITVLRRERLHGIFHAHIHAPTFHAQHTQRTRVTFGGESVEKRSDLRELRSAGGRR